MDTTHSCCLYRNLNQRMVILRCIGPGHFFHEKVIFPFEDWLFTCPASSDVQIWSHGIGGTELLEAFSASDLLVDEHQKVAVTTVLGRDAEGQDESLGLAVAG